MLPLCASDDLTMVRTSINEPQNVSSILFQGVCISSSPDSLPLSESFRHIDKSSHVWNTDTIPRFEGIGTS
jgi:hypothetical protein